MRARKAGGTLGKVEALEVRDLALRVHKRLSPTLCMRPLLTLLLLTGSQVAWRDHMQSAN